MYDGGNGRMMSIHKSRTLFCDITQTSQHSRTTDVDNPIFVQRFTLCDNPARGRFRRSSSNCAANDSAQGRVAQGARENALRPLRRGDVPHARRVAMPNVRVQDRLLRLVSRPA